MSDVVKQKDLEDNKLAGRVNTVMGSIRISRKINRPKALMKILCALFPPRKKSLSGCSSGA